MIYEILGFVLFCYSLITSFFFPQLSLVDEALHTVSMLRQLFIITCKVKRRNHGERLYFDGDFLSRDKVYVVDYTNINDNKNVIQFFEHLVFVL